MDSSGQPIVIRRCALCHGLAGRSVDETLPDLPSMTETEIVTRLRAHRGGVEDDRTMDKVGFDLSNEEIQEAANYYSSLNRE